MRHFFGCPTFTDLPVQRRKTPWKLSRTRKANVRARLKRVDSVIEAVRASGVECKSLVRFYYSLLSSLSPISRRQTQALELPKEHEMPPRDKYTVFSRHEKGYRKGIHKVPKWTRVRLPPFSPRPHLLSSFCFSPDCTLTGCT